MKTSAVCLLVSVALGAGIGAGWWWRGSEPEVKVAGGGSVMRAVERGWVAKQGREGEVPGVAERALEETGVFVMTELERIKNMTVEEFGVEMATVWLNGEQDAA